MARESISLGLRFEILSRDNYTCQYCGAKAPDAALHVDHVTPVVLGGANTQDNLVTACVRCNLGKSDRQKTDFEDTRPYSARERRLANRSDWLVTQNEIIWWMNDLVAAPEVKAVLLCSLAWADAHGGVYTIDAAFADKSGLTCEQNLRIIRGLECASLIIPQNDHLSLNESGDRTVSFHINFHRRGVNENGVEHVRLPRMSDFTEAADLAPARWIYG
jgi:hypothetical protein